MKDHVLLLAAIFNNREAATLIWLGLIITAVLAAGQFRSIVGDLLKQIFWSKLTFIFVGVIAYVSLMVWGLASVGAWSSNQLFETIFWLFGPGFGLIFKLNDNKHPQPFRQSLISVVAFSVFIEFVANVYSFSFALELLLVPVVTLITIMVVVAGTKPEYSQVKRLFEGITVVIGFVLLFTAAAQAWNEPGSFFSWDNLRDLSVPMLLTVGFIPLAYGLAVLFSYEHLLVRVRIMIGERRPLYKFARKRAFQTAGLRVSSIKRLSPFMSRYLYTTCTEADIEKAIEQYRNPDEAA